MKPVNSREYFSGTGKSRAGKLFSMSEYNYIVFVLGMGNCTCSGNRMSAAVRMLACSLAVHENPRASRILCVKCTLISINSCLC